MDTESNCLTIDERRSMMNAVNVMSMAHIFHNGTRSNREQLSSLIFSMSFAHPPITSYKRNRRESDSECSIASSISTARGHKQTSPCTFSNEVYLYDINRDMERSHIIPTRCDDERQDVETVADECLAGNECNLQPFFVGELPAIHPDVVKFSSPQSLGHQMCSKISISSALIEREDVTTDVKTSPVSSAVEILVPVSSPYTFNKSSVQSVVIYVHDFKPLSGLLNTLTTSTDRHISDIDSVKEELDYPEEVSPIAESSTRVTTVETNPIHPVSYDIYIPVLNCFNKLF
uniref:Uncharacterized protein n=1 Tax=Heterorhabditis bacteriophora TaxID=37862 RepID=A0A1I7XPU9_HETBA